MNRIEPSRDVVLRSVTKAFDGVTVLDGLSLTVKGDGVTALMGASGRGKTTVTSLILGLVKQDAGEIENPHREISCAFQDPRLLPWLSAVDNVSLVLRGSHKEKRRVAEEILTRLGLGDALGKRPDELSGGMQQRVSLARAFASPHTLLILDEPFRGLDAENKRVVLDMIREEAERVPVILVTHDATDAEALGAVLVHL